jgi:hypothetical protein
MKIAKLKAVGSRKLRTIIQRIGVQFLIEDRIHPGGGGRNGRNGTMQEKAMVTDRNNDTISRSSLAYFVLDLMDAVHVSIPSLS